jgi:hypothetical protein
MNWWTWKEVSPGWFTDIWIAKVPDDFIPAEEDRVALQKVRRKSSVFGGGDEKNKRLSLGGGSVAAIVPVTGAAEGADAKASAKVDGVRKAPGEGGAGADEFGEVKKVDTEGVGAKMGGSTVPGDDSDGRQVGYDVAAAGRKIG